MARSLRSNNNGEQAEMITLLRKISQDNDALRQEMASVKSLQKDVTFLRHETVALRQEIGALREETFHNNDLVVEKMKGVLVELKSKIHIELKDVRLSLTREIELAALLIEHVDSSVKEGLSKLEGDLQRKISEIVYQGRDIIRSDIATFRRAFNASQILLSDQLRDQDDFQLFPKLPPELRLRIWKMACFNNPSVIKVHLSDPACKFYSSGYHVPAVLQVSRESRCEALKWYRGRSGIESRLKLEPKDGSDGITCIANRTNHCKYFNFETDILYLIVEETFTDLAIYGLWAKALINWSPLCAFHRVAIPFSNVYGQWNEIAPFLSNPRSKVEELLIVANGAEFSENDQWLSPITNDYEISRYGYNGLPSFHTDVGKELTYISEFLSSADINLHDDSDVELLEAELENELLILDGMIFNGEKYYEEESDETVLPSVDSSLLETATKTRNATNSKDLPKPWPKITFVELKDTYPIPQSRIFSA